MNLRRAVFSDGYWLGTCLMPLAAGPAAAQSPWPTPQQSAQSPWPQAPHSSQQPVQQAAPSPWAQPQQPAEPPCFKDFVKLRDEAQKRAHAIQTASERQPKPTAREACALFNSFSAAEAKMIKFATDHQASCGIPAPIVAQMKEQHVKTNGIRTNVCRAAAAPPRPAGPSLSDALSAPLPDSNNIRTGRGTFDTLTGTPLGK